MLKDYLTRKADYDYDFILITPYERYYGRPSMNGAPVFNNSVYQVYSRT
jgi:hypothetical protein